MIDVPAHAGVSHWSAITLWCTTGDVPAHAGVSPSATMGATTSYRRPRARGGEPKRAAAVWRVVATSPRTRG